MARVLMIGAGGVATVAAFKIAQNADVFTEFMIASRRKAKCDKIVEDIHKAGYTLDIKTAQVDADDVEQLKALFDDYKPELVINLALPYQDLTIMDACLACGCSYLDTANYEPKDEAHFEYSWQWAYRERFEQAGLTAILGCGFDPGVTSIYTAYAAKHHFKEIQYLDIVDCNAGDHHKAFATNFNPEINIREITQKGLYWENGQWVETEPLEIHKDLTYPNIGPRDSYLLHHEEIESLVINYPTIKRARFWMTFGQQYLKHLEVIQNIGMSRIDEVEYEAPLADGSGVAKVKIVPLQFLKAVLPNPQDLGENYEGETSIGCRIRGIGNDGREHTYYVYNNCSHRAAYEETGMQGVSYTTGVPAMIGAMMFCKGLWKKPGVHNVEEFDPDPFMEQLNKQGLPWHEIHDGDLELETTVQRRQTMKRILIALTVVLTTVVGWAQDVKIEFMAPNMVHVVKGTPTKSLVVTAKPGEVSVTKSGNTWKSSELTVRQDAQGRLTFLTAKGKVLLREGGWSLIRKTIDEWQVSQTFTLDKDEAIYGLGTIQDGKMNRRGTQKRMEQSNLEDFQNVLQSIKGWGLYWENYSPTDFADGQEGMTFTSEAGQGVDYYFMYGGSADGVIAQMRWLTGDVPMFPLWTYGFWQSKERYKTARETESIVDKYRELQVPLDGIIQDWQYWGSNYLWNAMDFLSEDFATGKQLIENVHRKHAHFMISIWASFGPQTKQFRELNEKGLLMPFETWPQSGISHVWPPMKEDYPSGVKVYDAFSPVARDIYWKYLRKLYDYGTDAWWMDSTDPDCFYPTEADYNHKVYGGTWRSQRNAFPLETVRGIYQSQRRDYADSPKRVFIMTRSSFAGQQHYGSNMWSGDVNSSWDMLRKQVPAGLSFTLTGNPNFNTDIGGFFCNAYNTMGPASAPKNPQFQELYVRWMQYGLFCPVFRSHGADAPREIWQFGKKGEPVYDAIEEAIGLRYQLIPYLYSTAWQVTSNNDSYMRPLFADFASDKRVWNMTDEFMFGRSILACPIVDPQYTEEKIIRTDAMTGWDRNELRIRNEELRIDWAAKKSAVKYLPKGAEWYDFWTGKRYKGGQTVTLETQLNRVPMFVRAGSIVPMGPVMQYVGEKSWDELELRVYPGADGRFSLYEDEGDSYRYEQGVYSVIPMQWDNRTRTLTIGSRQGSYPGMIGKRTFIVITPDGSRQTVTYEGQTVTCKL